MSTTMHRAATRTTWHLEDVDWMLECGEHPERIAARVGVSVSAIAKAYYRDGQKAKGNLFRARRTKKVPA